MPEETLQESEAGTDPVETTEPDTGDAAPEGDASEQPPKKPTETVEFWKSKAREQEKRAKENAAAAKELADLKESQKTELQKAIERADAAEGALGALKAAEQIREWKSATAKKFGVPADALRGVDLDEIEEHAATLKSLLPEPRKPGHVPGEGRTVQPGSGDPAQQFAEILRNARK
ncbi:helicase [Mycobacterium sp. E1747]|uniref:helicase n=1 Tax=Mycobacterium sp. E1747 TaxID=1834128 RepID=UPI000AB603A3|nr:helicase [Mycobacterium sp. E1747]